MTHNSNNLPRYGHRKGATQSQETRHKISEAKKGTGRLIRQSRLNGEVVAEATLNVYLEQGFSRQCISLACLGRMKRYKGFTWKYIERPSDKDKQP